MDPAIATARLTAFAFEALAELPPPQCHTDANGDRVWLLPDGFYHRLDGPAVERVSGEREWWVDGRVHREDGPAVERADGTRHWWWADSEYAWALPGALWREAAVRTALCWIEEPGEQRAAALALLPTLAPELQRAAVAEALADRDPELRLWGLRAAAGVDQVGQGERAVLDDAAVESTPPPGPTPTPALRRREAGARVV